MELPERGLFPIRLRRRYGSFVVGTIVVLLADARANLDLVRCGKAAHNPEDAQAVLKTVRARAAEVKKLAEP